MQEVMRGEGTGRGGEGGKRSRWEDRGRMTVRKGGDREEKGRRKVTRKNGKEGSAREGEETADDEGRKGREKRSWAARTHLWCSIPNFSLIEATVPLL